MPEREGNGGDIINIGDSQEEVREKRDSGGQTKTNGEIERSKFFQKRLEQILKETHSGRSVVFPQFSDLELDYDESNKRVEVKSDEFNFNSPSQRYATSQDIRKEFLEHWDKISNQDPPIEQIRLINPEVLDSLEAKIADKLSEQEIHLGTNLPEDREVEITDMKEADLEVCIKGSFDFRSDSRKADAENNFKSKINMRMNEYRIEDLNIMDTAK